MGRNKLPNELKIIRGTSQPCRQNNKSCVEFISPNPVVTPKNLKGIARKIFEQKSLQLMNLGLFSELDIDLLSVYAKTYALMIEAEKNISKEGMVVWIKDEDGNLLKQSPNVWYKVLVDAIKNINLIGQQFGFTPISRTKFVMPEVKPQDDFADFEEL